MKQEKRLELRKFVAPEFVFGENALNLAGQYSENFGAMKALIVTDPGVRKAGWAGKVETVLKSHRISYAVFDGVTANPKDSEVMAGADYYQREKCDVIIAVGGGSPMDCAKGIGIVTTNQENILDFEGVDEVTVPGPPLICIPTTAGTSADVSQFSIITDTPRGVKIAIISKSVVPDIALIDPATTLTMSLELTAATGMDALVHAVEAYVSNASSPITDINALEAIRLIAIELPKAILNPSDMAARDHMMLASLHAGLAFSNASLGLVHGMAHCLGGLLDLAHGDCNAILLEHVVDFNFDAIPHKYAKIGSAMGLAMNKLNRDEQKSTLLHALSEFRKKVGDRQNLTDLGVNPSDIPRLAENAINDPCLATNPKQPTIKQIEALYEKAL